MRHWIAAALALVLGLSLTACGTEGAATAANRWDNALQQQANARGPLEERSDGAYYADENGRVRGFDQEGTDSTARQELDQAGEDLGRAAQHAGQAAQDAADQAGKAAQDAAKNAQDAARSVGDAAEEALDDAADEAAQARRDAAG